MPLSKKQQEKRLARRQTALEADNRSRWTLVSRGRIFGRYDNDYCTVELLSGDMGTATRALAARLRGEENWRDV